MHVITTSQMYEHSYIQTNHSFIVSAAFQVPTYRASSDSL